MLVLKNQLKLKRTIGPDFPLTSSISPSVPLTPRNFLLPGVMNRSLILCATLRPVQQQSKDSPKCGLHKRSAKLRPSNALPLSWQGTEPVLHFALVKLNVQFRAAFFWSKDGSVLGFQLFWSSGVTQMWGCSTTDVVPSCHVGKLDMPLVDFAQWRIET